MCRNKGTVTAETHGGREINVVSLPFWLKSSVCDLKVFG